MALFTIGFHLYSVVPTPSFIHLNRPLSHEQVGAYLHSRNFADLLRHRKPYLYKGGSSQSFSVLTHLDTSPITRDYILIGYPHDLTSHSQSQSVLVRSSQEAFISSQDNIPPFLLCASITHRVILRKVAKNSQRQLLR